MRRGRLVWLAASGAVALATAAPAAAAPALHVAPGGSDGGRCTAARPCASFDRAYHVARAGQVVRVRRRVSRPADHAAGGALASPVVFRPAAGAQVTVGDLALTGSQVAFERMSFDSWTADRSAHHLTFRSVRTGAFFVNSASYIRILGGSVGPARDVHAQIASWPTGTRPHDILIDRVPLPRLPPQRARRPHRVPPDRLGPAHHDLAQPLPRLRRLRAVPDRVQRRRATDRGDDREQRVRRRRLGRLLLPGVQPAGRLVRRRRAAQLVPAGHDVAGFRRPGRRSAGSGSPRTSGSPGRPPAIGASTGRATCGRARPPLRPRRPHRADGVPRPGAGGRPSPARRRRDRPRRPHELPADRRRRPPPPAGTRTGRGRRRVRLTLYRDPTRRPTLPADHAAEEAPMGTVQLELLNTKDFVAAGFTAAIVPLGACESHGDHMPLGRTGSPPTRWRSASPSSWSAPSSCRRTTSA